MFPSALVQREIEFVAAKQAKAAAKQHAHAAAPGVSYSSSAHSSSSPSPPAAVSYDNQFRPPSRYLFPPSLYSSIHSWKRPGRPCSGLRNLGNTCFLNSVLQCLLATPPLVNYAGSKNHSRTCKTNTFCLFCEFERLAAAALTSTSAIQPSRLVSNLRVISPTLRPGRQEDAHEFLRFAVEALQQAALRQHPEVHQHDHRVKETSIVYSMFGGYFRSQVRCSRCQHESNTFDVFEDLSLELANSTSIVQALRHFTSPEQLDADNLYSCKSCSQRVRARKQLTIFKAPNVLVVHLKRFQFANAFGGKIGRAIEFAPHLDLREFMSDPASCGNVKYSLYGVLVHSGVSIHGGHYYCFVKAADGQWYCMDDSSVQSVPLSVVLQQRAYLLFYSRVQPDASEPTAPPLEFTVPIKAPVEPPSAPACCSSESCSHGASRFMVEFGGLPAFSSFRRLVRSRYSPCFQVPAHVLRDRRLARVIRIENEETNSQPSEQQASASEVAEDSERRARRLAAGVVRSSGSLAHELAQRVDTWEGKESARLEAKAPSLFYKRNEFDEELDRGHVRKVRAKLGDGPAPLKGSAGAERFGENLFQRQANIRNFAKTNHN